MLAIPDFVTALAVLMAAFAAFMFIVVYSDRNR